MRQRGILRGLTPGHLLAFTVLVGIFVFLNTHPIRPHDFWWHLAVGREIVRTGRIPLVDTFSYTRAGTPYPSYAMFWLAEVLYYGLYTTGGPALIVFFHSLLITTAYGLILWAAWEAGGPRAAAAGTLLAAALGIDDWNVRPQAFGFLAGAMFLRALSGLERSPRWRWAFPLGMLLWVNTHGSFPIGLLMAGLAVAEAAWRVFRKEAGKEALGLRAQAFALALLSTGLNPRGFGVYEYLAMMARNPMLRSLVPEWAPPGLDRHGLLFYIGLAGVGALLLLPPRRTDPGLLLRLGPFAALGLWTSRGIVWFGMVAAPAVAEPPAKAGLISAETPVAATAFLLRERPPGPLFHALSFGSYLIWAAQPDYPVFVDPRLELYPMAIWEDYLAISGGAPDWEARLARYGVRLLMLSPAEQPALMVAVAGSPRWERIYRDDAAEIWRRR
jgi:hypothetical protein